MRGVRAWSNTFIISSNVSWYSNQIEFSLKILESFIVIFCFKRNLVIILQAVNKNEMIVIFKQSL